MPGAQSCVCGSVESIGRSGLRGLCQLTEKPFDFAARNEQSARSGVGHSDRVNTPLRYPSVETAGRAAEYRYGFRRGQQGRQVGDQFPDPLRNTKRLFATHTVNAS